MPADVPPLATIRNVELIRTGRWETMTGTWDVGAGDLVAAVAALECPSLKRPVLKLGHLDQRFTPQENFPSFDGTPAIGWVENLRIIDGGHTLVGDFAQVPAWLDTIAASAYPKRSIEGGYNHRCGSGHTHPFALAAVSLLGATPPGVGALRTLHDIKVLYGLEAPVAASADAALVATIAAATADRDRLKRFWTKDPRGLARWAEKPHPFTALYRALKDHMPDEMAKRVAAEWFHEVKGFWPGDKRNRKKVAAAYDGGSMPSPEPTHEDLIRAAFNQSAPHSQWIVEVGADEVVVIDDGDRSLHRIPVTVAAGTVTFGQATPVRMAYVPASEQPVAASRVVFASRAESRPDPAPTPDEAEERIAAALEADGTGGGNVAALDPPLDNAAPLPPGLTTVVNDTGQPEPVAAPPTETVEHNQTPPPAGGVPVSPGPAPDQPAARPDPTEERDDMSLSEFRSRLGLPDDADEAAVLAALDARLQPAPDPAPEAVTEPQPVAASTALPSGVVTIEASVLDELRRNVQMGVQAAQRQATEDRDRYILACRDDGKVLPARVEFWKGQYDKDPEGTRQHLDGLERGALVPVAASGYTGTGEESGNTAELAAFDALFTVKPVAQGV